MKLNEPFFDLMFCTTLSKLDLFKVDEFLEGILTDQFAGEFTKFARFISLAQRKHGKELLNADITDTVKEWLNFQEKEPVTKRKGIIKREPGDKITCLNQEQTALLACFLQEERVILKDEYLSCKQAGNALSILTGFSADKLRQRMSKVEIERLSSKENLTHLHSIVTRISIEIIKKIQNV